MRNTIGATVVSAALAFVAGRATVGQDKPRLAPVTRKDVPPCVCSAPGLRQFFTRDHDGEACEEKAADSFLPGYVPRKGKVVCP